MPNISIIMPTYNRARYLKDAVDSVLAQTYQDWELIVVDDGSTDHTVEVLNQCVKQDKRIYYIHQSNLGGATARNAALTKSTGQYIAFIDDDDCWLPKKLEMQVKLMDSRPEVGFCYTRFQIYKKVEDRLEKGTLFPPFLATKFEELFDAFIAPSAAIFRKTCLDQAGWFNVQHSRCEDFDLWLRVGQITQIAPIDEVGAFTVMDERHRGIDNEILSWKMGIKFIKRIKLTPQYSYYRPFLKTHIAKRHYWIAREDLDHQRYWSAAIHFAKAILEDPLIGLSVRRLESKGNMISILKPYIAVPVSFVKGLIRGRR